MPITPPGENVQIIKIDDGQFYRATTASTMIDVATVKADILRLEGLIAQRYALLAAAAAQGVADAAAAVAARKG